MAAAHIPATTLTYKGTYAELSAKLLERETGWCTDDNILYVKGENGLVPLSKVVVIDDILDTGNTMNTLASMLKESGVADIRTCVLMNKEERRTVNFHADFVGFEIANEFVVGYGLDFNEDYRTLPEIWTLEEI